MVFQNNHTTNTTKKQYDIRMQDEVGKSNNNFEQ
jgi:hypothetical protein